jgi:hypothetical protein
MNDDYYFLQWDDVQSGRSVRVFQYKLLPPPPTLMKEAAGYFETPVNFCQTTPRHNTEHSILHSNCCEKSQLIIKNVLIHLSAQVLCS